MSEKPDAKLSDHADFNVRLAALEASLDNIPVDDALDLLAFATAGVMLYSLPSCCDRHSAMILQSQLATFIATVQRTVIEIDKHADGEEVSRPGETLQ